MIPQIKIDRWWWLSHVISPLNVICDISNFSTKKHDNITSTINQWWCHGTKIFLMYHKSTIRYQDYEWKHNQHKINQVEPIKMLHSIISIVIPLSYLQLKTIFNVMQRLQKGFIPLRSISWKCYHHWMTSMVLNRICQEEKSSRLSCKANAISNARFIETSAHSNTYISNIPSE